MLSFLYVRLRDGYLMTEIVYDHQSGLATFRRDDSFTQIFLSYADVRSIALIMRIPFRDH